jgi:hypothetical protein
VDVLVWLAEGVRATERGESWYQVAPQEAGCQRLFWSGPVIDPDTDALAPYVAEGDTTWDNRISNKHLAQGYAAKLAADGIPATTIDQTPDGQVIEHLDLYSTATRDYIDEARENIPRVRAALEGLYEDQVDASGTVQRPAHLVFAQRVWEALSTQYARDASAAIEADPENNAVGVVTQGLHRGTIYETHEYPQLKDHPEHIVYTEQVQDRDDHVVPRDQRLPGAATEAELAAKGRGMTTYEEPVAHAGHVSTLDYDAIERRLAASDETIAAAREQLDSAENPPVVVEEEPVPMLSADSAHRLAAVNARAKLALSGARPAQPAKRPSLAPTAHTPTRGRRVDFH